MDPITGLAVVGGGYLLYEKGYGKKPEDTQPEHTGPVIVSKPKLPAGDDARNRAIGGGVGGTLAAGLTMLGGAAAAYFPQLTAGYNAPVAKAVAQTTLIAAAAIGGAIVIFIAIEFTVIQAGAVGIVVALVLGIIFSAFLIAANIEDVDRWNNYTTRKQIIVKLVAGGSFKTALAMAQAGGEQGIPGLGFYISLEPTVYHQDQLYYKTAFDATPKIPNPVTGLGLINRGGLDKDYVFPKLVAYDYTTYFGTDGAHMGSLANGAPINYITFLTALYGAQKSAYDGLTKELGRMPTYGEWLTAADNIKDPDGVTLRQWIGLHDTFGEHIQPNVPWIDVYLLQSPEFAFAPDPKGPAIPEHKRSYAVNDAVSRLSFF